MKAFISYIAVFAVLPVPTYFFLLAVGVTAIYLRKAKTWLQVLAGLFCTWIYLFSTPAISNVGIRALEETEFLQPKGSPTHIVVLGAGWLQKTESGWHPKLGEDGWERLHRGFKEWQANPHLTLVLTGGSNQLGVPSQAKLMADILVSWGVPVEQLILETSAKTTYQNASKVKQLLPETSHISLVTSALHMPRAYRTFTKQGFEVTAIKSDSITIGRLAAKSWFPSLSGIERSHDLLHEWIGLTLYKAKNRI